MYIIFMEITVIVNVLEELDVSWHAEDAVNAGLKKIMSKMGNWDEKEVRWLRWWCLDRSQKC